MPEFESSESKHYQGVEQFENAIFRGMNQSRKGIGLTPLQHDEVLAYIARLHSRDMGQNSYFSHESDEGLSTYDRISMFGYECGGGYLENLSSVKIWGDGEDVDDISAEVASKVVDSWETSDEHRRAMWSESVEVAGVGCYITAEHELYVTCDFCSHDPADASDAATGTPPEEGCYYGGDRP